MSTASLPRRVLNRVVSWREDQHCKRLCPYAIADRYQRIYFYHIPKTGGTSLNIALLSLFTPDPQQIYLALAAHRQHRLILEDRIIIGWNPHLCEKGQFFYGFAHTPAYEFTLPPHTFTFTCLRDPVKRVVSHYKMILEEIEQWGFDHPRVREERQWIGQSFSDFLDNVPKEHLFNHLSMFSRDRNIAEAADAIAACSHVCFTEQLSKGIEQLSAHLGFQIPALHIRKAKVSAEISERDIERLREMMEPEYQLLEEVRKNLSHGLPAESSMVR